jgi:glycosyltransferase involved in cell wall biosynthesis
MKKILFLATYPHQTNGYAKIGHKITNYLANFYKIYYFGFSNYKDAFVPRDNHNNIEIIDVVEEEKKRDFNDSFGVDIIEEYVREIQPDIIVLYNDIIVTCRHLNVLNKLKPELGFKFISYLDLVYDFERPYYIDFVNSSSDMIMVFSEHWKQNLIKMGVNKPIKIIPHGINVKKIFKVDKMEARKSLGINEDDFVILNCNRNSYRKANDMTISAFLKLLKMCNMNPKLKLLLHCDLDVDSGYNLIEVIKIECIKEELNYDNIVSNYIIQLANKRLSDEGINLLYNACDVGINTCIGEGFGLCSFEHITLGKPQVVSKVGAHNDIFDGYDEFLIEPVTELNISAHTDAHCGTIKICRSKDFADKLYTFFNYYKKYEIIAGSCGKSIKEKYEWENILVYMKNCIDEA